MGNIQWDCIHLSFTARTTKIEQQKLFRSCSIFYCLESRLFGPAGFTKITMDKAQLLKTVESLKFQLQIQRMPVSKCSAEWVLHHGCCFERNWNIGSRLVRESYFLSFSNHRLGVLFFDIFAVQGGFRWFHVDESSLKATLDWIIILIW